MFTFINLADGCILRNKAESYQGFIVLSKFNIPSTPKSIKVTFMLYKKDVP